MPVDSNNDSNPSSIDIHSNQGDTIGVGVDGSGNIIGKNISVVINEFSQDCGLTLIAPNHFKDYTNTDENFNQWLDKGYPLSLESVYQGRELKRDRILNEIRDKLEEKKRLLILGESGTSKTILLNEVICEYFDKGYKILYNTGGDNLKDTNTIIEKIIGLALAGNRVLVVVDNVHTTHVSLIFHVVKNLNSLNEEIRKNIRFLLAARLPEFTWALERNLFGDAMLVQIIKSLFGNDEFKLIVKYFDKEEVKAFIKKYYSFINPILKNKSLEQNTEEII